MLLNYLIVLLYLQPHFKQQRKERACSSPKLFKSYKMGAVIMVLEKRNSSTKKPQRESF